MGRPHDLLILHPPEQLPAGRRLVGVKVPDWTSAGEVERLGGVLDQLPAPQLSDGGGTEEIPENGAA